MNWKKRTPQEIEKSLEKNDITGGYKFLPWIWHMRKFTAFAFFLNIFLGWKAYEGYLVYEELVTLIVSIFFGIGVPSLIGFMLYREHSDKKKGISR